MARRIIGIVAAVVLAAVGTGVLVVFVKGAEQRALAGERTVEVLVVQTPVKKGTPAEQLADLVDTKTVPAKVQASGSVASLADVAGRVTAVDLVPGEQLVESRFVEADELVAEDLDIPDGLQLVTVSLEPNRVLGGDLNPGQSVGVIASFEDAPAGDAPADADAAPAGEGNQATHFILQKILVAKVQGEPVPAVAEEKPEGATAAQGGPRPGVPASNLLVTFAVDAPAAERLVFAAEHGTIWLSLQTDDTSEDGTRIQTKETIYR